MSAYYFISKRGSIENYCIISLLLLMLIIIIFFPFEPFKSFVVRNDRPVSKEKEQHSLVSALIKYNEVVALLRGKLQNPTVKHIHWARHLFRSLMHQLTVTFGLDFNHLPEIFLRFSYAFR